MIWRKVPVCGGIVIHWRAGSGDPVCQALALQNECPGKRNVAEKQQDATNRPNRGPKVLQVRPKTDAALVFNLLVCLGEIKALVCRVPIRWYGCPSIDAHDRTAVSACQNSRRDGFFSMRRRADWCRIAKYLRLCPLHDPRGCPGWQFQVQGIGSVASDLEHSSEHCGLGGAIIENVWVLVYPSPNPFDFTAARVRRPRHWFGPAPHGSCVTSTWVLPASRFLEMPSNTICFTSLLSSRHRQPLPSYCIIELP